MSFGWSAADIAALVKLSYNVVQNCRKACGEYDELTRQVDSLYRVLKSLRNEHAKPESLLHKSEGGEGDAVWQDLKPSVDGSQEILTALNVIVKKYAGINRRDTTLGRLWQRAKFGNKELSDLNDLRQRARFYTGAISTVLGSVTVGSLGRIEKQIDEAGLKDLKPSIEDLARKLAKANVGGGSVLTAYTNDDTKVWRELRRELCKAGAAPSNVIGRNMHIIKDFVMELGERGELDESGDKEEGAAHPAMGASPDEPVRRSSARPRNISRVNYTVRPAVGTSSNEEVRRSSARPRTFKNGRKDTAGSAQEASPNEPLRRSSTRPFTSTTQHRVNRVGPDDPGKDRAARVGDSDDDSLDAEPSDDDDPKTAKKFTTAYEYMHHARGLSSRPQMSSRDRPERARPPPRRPDPSQRRSRRRDQKRPFQEDPIFGEVLPLAREEIYIERVPLRETATESTKPTNTSASAQRLPRRARFVDLSESSDASGKADDDSDSRFDMSDQSDDGASWTSQPEPICIIWDGIMENGLSSLYSQSLVMQQLESVPDLLRNLFHRQPRFRTSACPVCEGEHGSHKGIWFLATPWGHCLMVHRYNISELLLESRFMQSIIEQCHSEARAKAHKWEVAESGTQFGGEARQGRGRDLRVIEHHRDRWSGFLKEYDQGDLLLSRMYVLLTDSARPDEKADNIFCDVSSWSAEFWGQCGDIVFRWLVDDSVPPSDRPRPFRRKEMELAECQLDDISRDFYNNYRIRVGNFLHDTFPTRAAVQKWHRSLNESITQNVLLEIDKLEGGEPAFRWQRKQLVGLVQAVLDDLERWKDWRLEDNQRTLDCQLDNIS